ncbi:MAG: serine/threonine protein kinase, partial [Symploca sp. SIO2B6]|nr:serine/threonine protein kinase [Symploca sp. SIO2B6]
MALCINPTCSHPNHPNNGVDTRCHACHADLILRGRYRVMRLITNTSGFGKVYEVFERDQPKILKVLKPAYSLHPKAIQLFEQEATVLSRLAHSGVPRIDPEGCFQFVPLEGSPPLHCMVMEKIDGPNLSEWMRQQGNHPIGEAQALQWLQQLAEVLHLIHQQQFFHRDIKPENIMLRSSGQLVLVDFGAVREMSYTYFEQLESTGGITRISSAGYTPPEQERGQAVLQSDFYSLGCTFIYLLTGKKPLDGDIYNHLTNELRWRSLAPHLSTEFADFIDQLIAERVVDRPTNTVEILTRLNQLQERLHQNKGKGMGGNLNDPCPKTDSVSPPSAPVPGIVTATLPPEEMGLGGDPTTIPEQTQGQFAAQPSASVPSSPHRYPPHSSSPVVPSPTVVPSSTRPPDSSSDRTIVQSATTLQSAPS